MNILITTKESIKIDYLKDTNVEYLSDLGLASIEEIEDKYDVIVGGFELKKFDFSRFLKLKFIQLISAGYDYIELDEKTNIMLSNARGVYSNAIAEWILSALLMEIKGFRTMFKHQIEKRWERNIKSQDLKDRRILIFGTGSIGSETARLLRLHGVEVDGVNSNGRDIEGFRYTLSLSQSKTRMRDYDILVFCLPSNSDTNHFLNEASVSELKSDSIVINVGRGNLITKEAIQKRSDVRFILDVHHIEPLPIESELWTLDNLLISPHISFQSNEYVDSLIDLIQINISNLMTNKEVVNRVK